jgi:flagellar biosynthesis/type III secretory pathway protein FliH
MGMIDAGVDAQIQEIARALLGEDQVGAGAVQRR